MAHLLGTQNVGALAGSRKLLEGVTVGLDDGSRVGILGPNGAGKSTLLRIVAGTQEPDGGVVTRRDGVRVAVLTQADTLNPEDTVIEAVHPGLEEYEWASDPAVRDIHAGLLADIDPAALDLTGADLSLGMLERCRDVWRKKAAGLDLVHCNAEDLPFADNMFDVVFHVGGINFFSDKQKAINEMLRVAKPGTKIMIADETTDFIQQQYKKSLFTRNYFQDTDFDLTQIENCIPETVQEKKTRLLWDNRFYCITFRKPV